MRGRFGDGRLGGETFDDDSADPMSGVANLADVMLVFACGLMLALVINWNVDIAPRNNDTAATEIMNEMEITGSSDETLDGDTQYEMMGTVYRDPATGKLYLVAEGGEIEVSE
ncbi:MAG: DUF2149 domain-containing protein [Peptococcaceae bacterium]|jgi:hypothetical protein|nr:DUF2149 domain-containing protein [Peptococcaceae bacterium]